MRVCNSGTIYQADTVKVIVCFQENWFQSFIADVSCVHEGELSYPIKAVVKGSTVEQIIREGFDSADQSQVFQFSGIG